MAEGKKAGRKSPVDRSGNEAAFATTVVKNVKGEAPLSTGEQRAKIGKTGKKGS